MSDPDANISLVLGDSKARREGYLAGRRGRTGADNPYERDTREACAWLMGMLDGRGRQLLVVHTGDSRDQQANS